jgi:hypothetical protein
MALMMTVVVIVMVALAIAIAATIAMSVVMPAHVDLLIRSWKNSRRRLGPSYLAMPIEPPLGMPIAAAMVWLTDAARPGGTYIVVPAFT